MTSAPSALRRSTFSLDCLSVMVKTIFVAAHRGDQGQPHAGVAGSAFDDGAAGLQQAALFRIVDHGDADAILHRSAGIDVVGFDVDLRLQALVDAIQPHQRSAANGFENVIAAHVRQSV